MVTCERREKHGSGQTNQTADTQKPEEKKVHKVKKVNVWFESYIQESCKFAKQFGPVRILSFSVRKLVLKTVSC